MADIKKATRAGTWAATDGSANTAILPPRRSVGKGGERDRPAGAIEAEQSLLSAALQGDAEALAEVFRIPAHVWSNSSCRSLAEAFQSCLSDGKTPEAAELVARGVAGWVIAELSSVSPTCNPLARAQEITSAWQDQNRRAGVRSLADEADRLSPAELALRIMALQGEAESYQGLTATNIIDAPAPPSPIFQHGPVPGILAILAAESGKGKSYAAQELAAMVATGREILPTFKRTGDPSGKVIAVCYEDPASVIRERLIERVGSMERGLGDDLYNAMRTGRLQFFCEAGPLFTMNAAKKLVPTATFQALDSLLSLEKPDLVVIDPLSGAAELSDENSNSELGAVARHLANLAKKHNTVILLVHHSSKNRAEEPSQHMVRGGSGLACRARWIATLTSPATLPPNALELRVVKNSYAAVPAPVILRRGPGGELSELTRPDVDSLDVANAIAGWLSEHPEAQVTAGGLDQNNGADNKLCRAALNAKFPWLSTSDVGKAVEEGRKKKVLLEVIETRPNRSRVAVLRPGELPQDEDDDTPF